MNMKTLTDAQLNFLIYRRDLNDMEIDAAVREQDVRMRLREIWKSS